MSYRKLSAEYVRFYESKIQYKRKTDVSFKITRSDDVIRFIRPYFEDDMDLREKIVIIAMNNNSNVLSLRIFELGIGGTTRCMVDVKLVMKFLIESLATSAIVVHNHPSGNPKFSSDDVKVTRQMKECCQMFNIDLLDHLIIFSDGHKSMLDEGLI